MQACLRAPLSNPAGAGRGQRGGGRREAAEKGGGEWPCAAQPAPRRLLQAGPQPLDLKERLRRPVGGTGMVFAAKARAELAAAQPTGWVPHWTENVTPPPP